MKIHYLNKQGQEKMLHNIIHLQNVDNEKFLATNEDGKEYNLMVSGIEGIYYKDNNSEQNNNLPSLVQPIFSDKKVSLKAKGLYAILKSYKQIPNFKIYKENMEKLSSDGKASFNTAWSELVEQGYLKVNKLPAKKGYIYEYELI